MTNMEQWKTIKDFPNYQVSNFGNIKNKKGKIIKPTINKKGYLIVKLWNKGQNKWFRIHRLVAKAFIPIPDDFLQINHKN